MKEIKKFFFTKHIVDAMRININRLGKYGKLTDNESRSLSLTLIGSEVLFLPFSIFFDLWALPLQLKNIPILNLELIDMKETPDFKGIIFVEKKAQKLEEIFDEKLIKDLLRKNEHQKLHSLLEEMIGNIKSPYFPMLRHLLESMARAISAREYYLAKPEYEKAIKVNEYFIKSHLLSFSLANYIDTKANPFLAKGVPIIYGDVPPIKTKLDSSI